MIRNEYIKQTEFETVTIEQLVPADHILRKIEEHYDFSFVRQRMESLYCKKQGRPAIDPVVLFKMLLIGYIFGIRSERQLEKEIQVNVAYRWFLHLNLTERVPDHSTISQNRRRRFQGTDVFRQMFDDVVLYAFEHDFLEGKILYTDSTHLKANANKKKFSRELVSADTQVYLEELERSVDEDRIEHGKKPLPPKAKSEEKPQKEIKVSKTDPESGYMARTGKPEGFHYLDHRTCDNKHNLITDVFITPGNINDSTVYLDRLEYQEKHFGFGVEAVALDSGYHTPYICKTLAEKGIVASIAYRKPGGQKGLYRKSKFAYNAEGDYYVCPEGQVLKYRTTGRTGTRSYASDPNLCCNCPCLKECTNNKKCQKIIERHVWERYTERVKEIRKTQFGDYLRRRRSETIERSFADAKELHGYRYARFRGKEKVETQALMTALAQNVLKMVRLMVKATDNPRKGGEKLSSSRILGLFSDILAWYWTLLSHLWINVKYLAVSS